MSETGEKDPAGGAIRPPFGMVAVELEYINSEQLKVALSEQVDDNLANRPHRPTGSILFDRGASTMHQLETVLEKPLKAIRTKKNKAAW